MLFLLSLLQRLKFFMGLAGLFYFGPVLAVGEPQLIYEQSCARCHDKGVLGAPLLGELTDRLNERGIEGLRLSITEGLGRMPKQGTCFSCTEAELDSVLEWMLQK